MENVGSYLWTEYAMLLFEINFKKVVIYKPSPSNSLPKSSKMDATRKGKSERNTTTMTGRTSRVEHHSHLEIRSSSEHCKFSETFPTLVHTIIARLWEVPTQTAQKVLQMSSGRYNVPWMSCGHFREVLMCHQCPQGVVMPRRCPVDVKIDPWMSNRCPQDILWPMNVSLTLTRGYNL